MNNALSASLRQVYAQCACFNSQRIARLLTRIYDKSLAPAGISSSQFTALIALSLEPSATLAELAARQTLDRTTLTRNIAVLERQGFIAAAGSGSQIDKRRRPLRVTPAGLATLEAALPLWHQAQEAVEAHLSSPDLIKHIKQLTKAIETVSEYEPVQ